MMLDKKELAEAYAERLVDDMDVNTLISCAIDYLSEDFKMFTLEELKAEIEQLKKSNNRNSELATRIDNLEAIILQMADGK